MDGEELDVPEDELLRGYSRQQDYTRKTMKLSEERKAFEEQAVKVREKEAQYAERLEAMKAFLDQNAPKEPDLKLRTENPTEYAAQWADYQRHVEAQNKVASEQNRIRQSQFEEQQTQLQAKIMEERKRLFDALPEWKNPDSARKEQEALIAYGTSVGFTDDELGNLYDHRAVLILDKARKWDELQKKGKTVKEKAVTAPVLKPGSPKPPQKPSTAKDAAAKRFRETGKPRDAAAFLEQLLAEEEAIKG